jgi:hypothetical protein
MTARGMWESAPRVLYLPIPYLLNIMYLHDAVSEKVCLRCYIAFHAFDLIALSIQSADT